MSSSRPRGTWTTILRGILWPAAAPLAAADDPDRTFWRAACVAAVFPLVAALHHLIFQPPTCMLNNFGDEYTLRIAADWLRRDASLPWGIVLGVVAYGLGRDRVWIRILVTPAFISFLLFSVWIWDIPLTGRIVCRSFHDARLLLGGVVVRTKHLYLAGVVPYAAFVVHAALKSRMRAASR